MTAKDGVVPDKVFVDASMIHSEQGAELLQLLLRRVVFRAIQKRLEIEMKLLHSGIFESSHWIRDVLPVRITDALCRPGDGDKLMSTRNLIALASDLQIDGFRTFYFAILERKFSIGSKKNGGWKRVKMTFYEHRKSSPDAGLQKILKEELEQILKERHL